MFKFLNKHRRLILIIVIITITTLALILIFGGQRHFYRKTLRQIETSIRSVGILSPIAVLALFFVSTAIPPLPLPIPLIEIASGLVFGFWYGFFICWIAQILSSLLAYYMAKHVGKKILKPLLKYKFMMFYKDYLNRSGNTAVFVTRATLASPFNIVSFLAGLSDMKIFNFMIATILGTIPESLLYTYIGSLIKTTRLSLGYVFIFALAIGGVGIITTFVLIEFINWKKNR